MYSDSQMSVLKGCVTMVFAHTTLEHVFWTIEYYANAATGENAIIIQATLK